MGRHSPAYLAQRQRHAGRHAVEMVDARTLTAHFLTDDAVAAGRRGEGRYVALCGEDVLPAALVAREARYCRLCAPIPTQRSRNRR